MWIPWHSIWNFRPLSDENIEVDVIVQNVSVDGKTDFTFTVSKEDEASATNIIKANKNSLQYNDVLVDPNVSKVSLVGVGMRTHAGIASEAFKSLAKNDINIQMISTSEIKITIVINEINTDKAVKCLHKTFNLDK